MSKGQSCRTAKGELRIADVPPPIGDSAALDAWTSAFYRRRFDERLARTEAAIHAARLSLAGARLRRLPSAGLDIVAGGLFGAWLGKTKG